MRTYIERRPKYLGDGEVAYYAHEPFLRKRPEFQLTLWIMIHRYLFGLIYGGLMPAYFYSMPLGSGVFVSPTVPTHLLRKDIIKPGDIDLLIIPYEDEELVLDQVLAVEIKIIQATFLKQGKSPGGMGFSQANGLIRMGFPHVAVAHLIVSDESPEETWKPMGVFRVLNSDGLLEPLPDQNVDHMPVHLMQRALRRMQAHSPVPQIGCAAVYLGQRSVIIENNHYDGSTWHPHVMPTSVNPNMDPELLTRVGKLFDRNFRMFMDIPRFSPSRCPPHGSRDSVGSEQADRG